MEIPLYMEPFWVYIAESCWRKLPVFRPEHLEHEQMWIMKESQCLRESAFSFCKTRNLGKRIYEAGSIDTLVRIVDENGGFSNSYKPVCIRNTCRVITLHTNPLDTTDKRSTFA